MMNARKLMAMRKRMAVRTLTSAPQRMAVEKPTGMPERMAVPKRVAVPKRMAPRRAALLPLAAALLATAAISSRAEAQQPAECGAEETGGAMAESTYRVLELAIEDLSNDRYAEAEKRLRNVMDRSQGYERAVIFQTLGFVYAQQEQLKPALEAFEEALAVGALQRDAQEDLMFNVGQIYIADEQYDRGIETIERYLEFACEPPPATAHMMLANAYAQQANYQSALQQVLLAFEKVETPEEQSKEPTAKPPDSPLEPSATACRLAGTCR
jgi:tetratricopeptide (TPR) repeat protein